ncbi:MAG: SDR family oxidoreductase [Acidobacteria bacterium]|nr:MAG: SDR family oxidoreductase [Acidobacteriota bacterium]
MATEFLITGGAGFIGSHLVRSLLDEGARVRVLDNFLTGKRENLADLTGNPSLVVMEGDVRDFAQVEEAMRGVAYVLHQAALPSVPRSVADPVTSMAIGVDGTLTVLRAAKAAGVKRVVYASSSSIYGDTPTLPKIESMIPTPLSPYAVSKLTGEHLCAVFSHLHGLPTVALRYFNVFGSRQDPASDYAAVVPKFATAALAGKSALIYGDGGQTRDFTFIDNVVRANRLACEAPEPAWGKAVNIACGLRISVNDLAQRIAAACGHDDLPPRYEDGRPGDVRHSLADISLAGKLLGYKPEIDLEEGLKRTIQWYRQA